MMITAVQARELLFIILAILAAAAIFSYEIGKRAGYAQAADDHDDGRPVLPPGPRHARPEPDLTIRLKHVAPSTAALFRQLEAEAGYQTTPLGQLVQPDPRCRALAARTTDQIAIWERDTSQFIEAMRS